MGKLTPWKYFEKDSVDVDLREDPWTRWQEPSRQIAGNIRGVYHDITELVDLHMAQEWAPLLKSLVKGLGKIAGKSIYGLAKACGADYPAEIASIASATGLPTSELFLANLIYDITQRYTVDPSLSAGCSTFSSNLPDGSPVLGRNMDWNIPPSTGKHTVLYRFHRGDDHYFSLGVAGMVGVVTAWRPGHWAIALNQAPAGLLPCTTQMPVCQRLRQVCDQMGTYAELVEGVQEYQTASPFFAHIIGTNPEEHVVVNGLGDSFHERNFKGTHLVQANRFVPKKLRKYNTPKEWEEDGQTWMCSSPGRKKALEQQLKHEYPATVEEALKVLAKEPVTNEDTMHSLALCPGRDEKAILVRT